MMNPTIELNGLEVQLGSRTILHGLTGVLKSRAIGLLGPNGAGKSTLINTLILDGATTGMDPPARKRLIELIREIREASDICLLLSSHLLRDVEETCDEVLILRNGQIASICNLVEERRANRKFLELETIGAGQSFTSTLEGLGCECAVFSNGRIKVVMPDK